MGFISIRGLMEEYSRDLSELEVPELIGKYVGQDSLWAGVLWHPDLAHIHLSYGEPDPTKLPATPATPSFLTGAETVQPAEEPASGSSPRDGEIWQANLPDWLAGLEPESRQADVTEPGPAPAFSQSPVPPTQNPTIPDWLASIAKEPVSAMAFQAWKRVEVVPGSGRGKRWVSSHCVGDR